MSKKITHQININVYDENVDANMAIQAVNAAYKPNNNGVTTMFAISQETTLLVTQREDINKTYFYVETRKD